MQRRWTAGETRRYPVCESEATAPAGPARCKVNRNMLLPAIKANNNFGAGDKCWCGAAVELFPQYSLVLCIGPDIAFLKGNAAFGQKTLGLLAHSATRLGKKLNLHALNF